MYSYSEQFQELLKEESRVGIMTRGLLFITKFVTMPIFVLLRRNFGERYFSILPMFIYIGILCLLPTADRDSDTDIIGDLTLWQSVTAVLAVLTFYHAFVIWFRNNTGERWHSRYDGDSILDILPISRAWVRLAYEPLFVFILAVIVGMYYPENPLIYPWLLAAPFFMILLERLNQSAARDVYLNAVDSHIESQHMSATLEGEPVRRTEGFVVRGISDVAPNKRKKMVDAMKRGFDTKEKAQASQSSGPLHVAQTPPPISRPTPKPQGETA